MNCKQLPIIGELDNKYHSGTVGILSLKTRMRIGVRHRQVTDWVERAKLLRGKLQIMQAVL